MRLLCRRALRFIPFIFAVFILSGCSAGIGEFQYYTQAFDAQLEQGHEALNRVAQAERIVVQRRLQRGGDIADFDPADAAYYLDTGDPPISGAIRGAMVSLKTYNDALGALASGEAASAFSNRIGTLASNLAATAGAFGVAASPAAAIPGGSALIGTGARAIGDALPIIEPLATIASREAFRRQLLSAYPHMQRLLLALRDGTPAMFEIIKRSYVQRGSLATASGIPAADLPRLERDRQILAGWVVLMDKTLVAMDTATQAVITGASPADIAALTEASIELRILAEKVRDIRTRR